MTALSDSKSKYAINMARGYMSTPSVATRKRNALIHCKVFFLSKNTHPTSQ